MKLSKSPTVSISARERHKIERWVDICKYEVSGLGLVDKVPGGYHVSEVFLLTQEVSSHETELDEMAIAKLQYELSQREEGLQDKLRFWWHSHVNMSVFWSSTDEEAITQLTGDDMFLVSSVFNKRGEVKTRVDMGFGHFRTKWDDLALDTAADRSTLASFTRAALRKIDPDGGTYKAIDIVEQVLEMVGFTKFPDSIFKEDEELEDFCKSEFEEKVSVPKTVRVTNFKPGKKGENFDNFYYNRIHPFVGEEFDFNGFQGTLDNPDEIMGKMRWRKK